MHASSKGLARLIVSTFIAGTYTRVIAFTRGAELRVRCSACLSTESTRIWVKMDVLIQWSGGLIIANATSAHAGSPSATTQSLPLNNLLPGQTLQLWLS
jgi:hypothetical protein